MVPHDPQAKHANGEHSWGIDGETGDIVDMKTYKLYESASVKVQSLVILAHRYISPDVMNNHFV